MSIEINNINVSGGRSRDPAGAGSAADKGRQSADSTRADAQAGEVKFSEDAQALQRVQANIEALDSFDAKRVDAIRSAISNGEYPIDNNKLAEKFLQLEALL